MTPRLAHLALAALLLAVPVAAARAQATDAAPFLTGPCSPSASLAGLDSLVEAPEVRPSLATFDSTLVPPAEIRARDHEMKVVIAFIVDTSGVVRPGYSAIMSSTDAPLSRWACQMVTRLRFHAARDHGRAVSAQVVMPFTFRPPGMRGEPAAAAPRT